MKQGDRHSDAERSGLSEPLVLTTELPVTALELVARRAAELALAEAGRSAPAAYLDVQQAADYLACEKHRIYDLVAEGRLRCAKDGRRSLFRREWLDEALDEGTAGR